MKRLALVLLSLALACPAVAQTGSRDDGASPSASVPAQPIDPAIRAARELDRLFGELHIKNLQDPKRVVDKILAAWKRNPSPTAELLLRQASLALDDGALQTSEAMLNQLIGTYPEYVEALNQRAALYLKLNRLDEALQDIDAVLEAEPRHFGALAGRGAVLAAQGNFDEAEQAFGEALAINPHLEVVRAALRMIENDTPGI